MKKVYKVLLHVGMIATIIGVSPCWASSGDGEELLKSFYSMPQSKQIEFLTTHAEELKSMQNYDLSSWIDDKGQKHWRDKETGLDHWYDKETGLEHWLGSERLEHWYAIDGQEHWYDDKGLDHWIDGGLEHYIGNDGCHYWNDGYSSEWVNAGKWEGK